MVTSETYKWIKDQNLEVNLFKPQNIKFTIETIKFSQIDLDEGLRNQVRLDEKLNDDTVMSYAEAMERGNAFKMVVLQKKAHNKYWPLSGNHRLAAVDVLAVNSPNLTIEAYVVDIVNPVMRDLFPRQVNLIEAAKGMSKEEQIINAQYMIEKHGFTAAEAAKAFHIKKEQIYIKQRETACKARIETLGVNASKFSSSLLIRLHAIQSGIVLRNTTNLLNKFDVRGKEADLIVYDVRKADSEATATTVLEKWETALTSRQKPKKKPAGAVVLPHREVNREQLFRLLTGLERYLDANNTITKAQISDPVHLDIVKNNWRKIKTRMNQLLSLEKE